MNSVPAAEIARKKRSAIRVRREQEAISQNKLAFPEKFSLATGKNDALNNIYEAKNYKLTLVPRIYLKNALLNNSWTHAKIC